MGCGSTCCLFLLLVERDTTWKENKSSYYIKGRYGRRLDERSRRFMFVFTTGAAWNGHRSMLIQISR